MSGNLYELMVRLLVAGTLGTLIGIEREYRGKEAGARTHFLVALGSALFMIVSLYGYHSFELSEYIRWDGSRIASQVVSGIGFIGAGTIIFRRESVHGLTTAAGVWVAAGIGLAVGAGLYLIGLFAALLIVITLEIMTYLFRHWGVKYVEIEFSATSRTTLDRVIESLGSKFSIVSLQVDERRCEDTAIYYASLVVRCKKIKSEEYIIKILRRFWDISICRIQQKIEEPLSNK
ncbi:MAG: MgtC/SapB family protein [Phocaeicola sp.]